jgi:histidine ammonia-lyase
MKKSISLNGNDLTLVQFENIAKGHAISIAPSALKKVKKGSEYTKSIHRSGKAVYGINTGFGYFAKTKIKESDQLKLQSNIIISHASGYGTPLTLPETRLAIALRLNALLKGYSGVRPELCLALFNLIKAEIYPIIPQCGSVGASGDLAPLAHLALPLIGEGDVMYQGKKISAKVALKKAGLEPLQLIEKEGLALVNGTQIMLSVGGLASIEAHRLTTLADKITALTFEALTGSYDCLNPHIHKVRHQRGQIVSAEVIRSQLSYPQNHHSKRLQDPYSLRCAPQIHGPCRDTIEHTLSIIEKEVNAATDNPLIFPDEKLVLSGGNFHGQPLAMAFDFASIAMTILSGISERRLDLLFNPQMSGLAAFLSPDEGIESGYMATQYLSASLLSENKMLSHPSSVDSTPGNVGIEDYVSMGMTSALKLKKIVTNTKCVLAIELLAACQALDLRKVKPAGKGTRKTYDTLRKHVPQLKQDRIVSNDIHLALEAIDKL